MTGIDRWRWTLSALHGAPWPVPTLPGRLCHPLGAWPTDYDADDLAALGPTDVAAITGISHQGASLRIARCRATNDYTTLLARPATRGAAANSKGLTKCPNNNS